MVLLSFSIKWCNEVQLVQSTCKIYLPKYVIPKTAVEIMNMWRVWTRHWHFLCSSQFLFSYKYCSSCVKRPFQSRSYHEVDKKSKNYFNSITGKNREIINSSSIYWLYFSQFYFTKNFYCLFLELNWKNKRNPKWRYYFCFLWLVA